MEMVDIEYANAYSEVLGILKCISAEEYNKIPKEKIQMFEMFSNKEYIFNYDTDKTLDEQNVSKRAKAVIAILFRDYWATDRQREKIVEKQKYDRRKLEEQKTEKYNPNDLFKNKKVESKQENFLVEVKIEKWYEKLFSVLKNMLKK